MRFGLAAASLLASASAFQPTFVPRQQNTALFMASQDELKKLVGYKAVDDYVKSGMVVGLGTGSTAYFAVERVGEKLKSGEHPLALDSPGALPASPCFVLLLLNLALLVLCSRDTAPTSRPAQ